MQPENIGRLLKSIFLLVSIFAFIHLPAVASSLAAEKAHHHIVIFGDPHLPGKHLDSKKRVVETVNSWTDVDMVVAVGDLCEDLGTTVEFGAVKDFFATLKKPLHPIVGNHDYIYADNLNVKGKRYRASSESSEAKLLMFRETFGLRDTSYSKMAGNYFLVFLSPDSPNHLAEISLNRLDWLRSELDSNRHRPTIIFFHAPLEGTLASYNKKANTPNYIAQPSGRIHDLLMASPQVFLWVSGHTHTTPNNESFASPSNIYEKRITNIHNSDMNRETIWTNSLFLHPDKVVIKTYNHKKGLWLPEFERTVIPTAINAH